MKRKPHVRVPQEVYVYTLVARGPMTLPTLAAHLNVSETTARRKLDGLVYQGKVRKRGVPDIVPTRWVYEVPK